MYMFVDNFILNKNMEGIKLCKHLYAIAWTMCRKSSGQQSIDILTSYILRMIVSHMKAPNVLHNSLFSEMITICWLVRWRRWTYVNQTSYSNDFNS